MKIARVASIPYAFVHIKKQLSFFKEKGINITLITSPGEYSNVLDQEVGLPIQEIEMPRNMSPLKDIKAFWNLYKLFKKEKFDIVHSTTPKAGILVALAAFFAATPVRLHTFTGQRWVSTTGILKTILRFCDRAIGILNTQVYADSDSQAKFLINEKIVLSKKISVINKGSLGGIDYHKFKKEIYLNQISEIKQDLGLDDNSLKLIFVGRVTKDKGIIELVETCLSLINQGNLLDLIIVGEFEPELDPLPKYIVSTIENHPNIHAVGFCNNPQKYLAISDLFCLPSYREGFGTVILEAAAMELPAIGTRIPGLIDSIKEKETGLLVTLHNRQELEDAIEEFINNPSLIRIMGKKAKERAIKEFSCEIIAQEQLQEYYQLVNV